MKILGISPLDKDATACLFTDGEVVSAIAEERLSRVKIHCGFPYKAVDKIFSLNNIRPEHIDKVVYAFADWEEESKLMHDAIRNHLAIEAKEIGSPITEAMRRLPHQPQRVYGIPGLDESELYMPKNSFYKAGYKLLSTNAKISKAFARKQARKWVNSASTDHKYWSAELDKGLRHYGLKDKLERVEHHLSHAANAYFTSGFDEALIVTLDGYGSGLGGSISVGKDGKIERLHSLPYPTSLGEFYERVTSSLGFSPGRHEGKIVGLAAYEDPDILFKTVMTFFDGEGETLKYRQPHNYSLSRHLASTFAKPTVAAAYQKVLETAVQNYIRPFLTQTGISNVVLSGGVVANVKANQRIFELEGVKKLFVHPNMGDGGCCVGAAQAVYSQTKVGLKPKPVNDVYWGPEYSDDAIEQALIDAKVKYKHIENIEVETARLLAENNIVARFAGRMEYGPRSLGNRSILYHAKDPQVNLWLNKQLGRTEFMPFAPATLYEEREYCYVNISGAEHTSMFMTITFDCTQKMKLDSPAAVHVDGTARPQLVSKCSNESFHKVLTEYFRLTGIPSLINTSFNMHEEPIVCSPADAIRAFKLSNIPFLAIGSFLAQRTISIHN